MLLCLPFFICASQEVDVINTDGVTAVYAVLLMLMKNESLDNANVLLYDEPNALQKMTLAIKRLVRSGTATVIVSELMLP